MVERVVVTRDVSFEELERRYKEEKDSKVKLRILMVLRVKEGASTTRLAKELHVHHTTVSNWVKRFNREGFDGLRDRPRSGRPPKISHEELREVLEKSPEEEGYPVGGWSVRLLHIHLAKKGVHYNRNHLYEVIRRHGYSLVKPRPTHAEADPEDARDFKKKSASS